MTIEMARAQASTGKAEYLEAAHAVARRIVTLPDIQERSSPDIISGAAGTGLFLLDMHEATGDAIYLEGARRLGDFLVARAESRGHGVTWKLYGDPGVQPVHYFRRLLTRARGDRLLP